MMYTDFHNHSLFGIDDGASSPEESIELLNMLVSQNVHRVVLTPHYNVDQNPSIFLRTRNKHFNAIKNYIPKCLKIQLACEVALADRLTTEINLSEFTVSKSRFIMIRLPFYSFENWIDTELHNILYKHRLFPIFTSMERYALTYPADKFSKLLSTPGAVFQFNSKAFVNPTTVDTIRSLISRNSTVLFGTNAHNCATRKPDYNTICESLKDSFDPVHFGYLMLQNDKFLR